MKRSRVVAPDPAHAPPEPALRRGGGGRGGWAALVLLLGGCASPSPIEPPRQAEVTFEGQTVVWSTSEPTLAAARYGLHPGTYRWVAYPRAAQRADKRYDLSHRVPLLGVGPGDTVHLQLLDRTAAGVLSASPEYIFVVPATAAAPPLLAWTMIDVGFGDSHLLTLPTSGGRVLIDAGERRDAANVDRFLSDAGIARLEAVIGTHIHEDHLGGLVGSAAFLDDGVLERWTVGTMLEGPDPSGSRAVHDELLAILNARAIPRTVIAPGETDRTQPALAWDPVVRVEVLNAGGGRAIGGEGESDWINNDSIVLRIGYGAVEFVLGADAESPVQQRLVTLGLPLESEALKVHHHGVASDTDPGYLDAVNPRLALIPICTYETYDGGLPSAVVLDRLRQRNVDIYASDRAEPLGILLAGDAGHHVTVLTDGGSCAVRVEPSRSQHYPGDSWALAPPGDFE